MAVTTEASVSVRKQELLDMIHAGIGRARYRSRANHWVSMVLMIIALSSSAGAGIGGLTANSIDKRTIGAVALIPASLALIANTMKFDEKAKYHNRKKTALQAIWRQLKFEMPLLPSDDEIAQISGRYSELDSRFNAEWETEFALNWGWTSARSRRT
jgi:hypothetical protein